MLTFNSLGKTNFSEKQNWTVFKSNQIECIVLIKDENYLYCASFDREKKVFDKKYRLILADDLKNGTFQDEHLGLMKTT